MIPSVAKDAGIEFEELQCVFLPPALPDSQQALQRLSERGEQFPETHRFVTRMAAVSYRHPENGRQAGFVDDYALSGVGTVYTRVPTHGSAFRSHGVETKMPIELLQMLGSIHKRGRLIWGFSGYASPGYSYAVEAYAMLKLLNHLQAVGWRPGLISDGGASDGVLGISGVLAAQFDIPSLGFIPMEGLVCFGLRTHLVPHKVTYRQREILVGITPGACLCGRCGWLIAGMRASRGGQWRSSAASATRLQ